MGQAACKKHYKNSGFTQDTMTASGTGEKQTSYKWRVSVAKLGIKQYLTPEVHLTSVFQLFHINVLFNLYVTLAHVIG